MATKPKSRGGTARKKAAPRKAKKAVRPAKKAVKAKKAAKPAKKAAKGKKVVKAAKKAVKAKKVVKAARSSRAAATGTRKRRKAPNARIVELLLKRRAQVLVNLGKLTGSSAGADSRPVGDRIDEAAFDTEVGSTYAIVEQETRELRLIDTALGKAEDGTYGICEDCGERIEKARLAALPYAVLCLKCKEAEELEQAGGTAY